MKKKSILLLLPILLSISCNDNVSLKALSPSGAPSICFYSEVNNSNFVTNTANNIAPHFKDKNSTYDMLVIDSVTGLNLTKTSQGKFKFAKLLTAGNLYFVGLKGNDSFPTSTSNIVAFGKESLTGLVFNKLLKDNPTWKSWGIDDSHIDWLNSVNEIAPIVKSGLYGGKPINYALIAEPLKTNLNEYISSNIRISLKDAWKDISGIDVIPQAALFINNDSYINKKDKVKEYINKINNNISIAVNDPLVMKQELDKQGSEDKIASKFNFTSTIAYNVMKDNNGFALYSSKEEYGCDKMNMFLNVLFDTTGQIYFDENYFINIHD